MGRVPKKRGGMDKLPFSTLSRFAFQNPQIRTSGFADHSKINIR
jgi:hypothetical protein